MFTPSSCVELRLRFKNAVSGKGQEKSFPSSQEDQEVLGSFQIPSQQQEEK